MHHGAAVVQSVAEGHLAALVQRGDGGVLLNELVGVGGDDLSDKGGDILKMVVKGVAVDAALLHNVPDADLVQGLFVEQLQKRRFNGLLGKICHTHLRLFCTRSLGKLIIADFSPADNPPKALKMGHTIPTVMTDGSQEQEVHAMRKKKPFHDPAPDIHDFPGVPESTFDLVNQYGTYNIQPTSHTENLFPLIGPELPERWRTMRLGKDDLEDL